MLHLTMKKLRITSKNRIHISKNKLIHLMNTTLQYTMVYRCQMLKKMQMKAVRKLLGWKK